MGKFKDEAQKARVEAINHLFCEAISETMKTLNRWKDSLPEALDAESTKKIFAKNLEVTEKKIKTFESKIVEGSEEPFESAKEAKEARAKISALIDSTNTVLEGTILVVGGTSLDEMLKSFQAHETGHKYRMSAHETDRKAINELKNSSDPKALENFLKDRKTTKIMPAGASMTAPVASQKPKSIGLEGQNII